ncbi:MAG: DUF308 domain-containing protein [Actinomycetota bacterium]|nr:DUF308 domain-containing protein [Actinomycetota bacterium]
MTAIHGFTDTFVTPLIRRWRLILAVGVLLVVLGVLLLVNLVDAAFTLAVLVGISLLVEGFDELMQAERHEVRWPGYVLGLVWILTGVIAIAWPDITLWSLALVTGISFVVGGIALVVFAGRFRRRLPRWNWWVVAGLLSVVAGIFCLAWPDVTILALAILLGLRVLMRGITTTMFALGLRQLEQMSSPNIPT